MTTQDVASALRRTERVLQKRPSAGSGEDTPGVARWTGGLGFSLRHPKGFELTTDMAEELGGGGTAATPGWMFRSSLAACTATCIAMAAALEGIELDDLEVRALSRSDARGVLGMADPDGAIVYAGPQDLVMQVRIAARGVAPERLRALAETGHNRAPVHLTVRDAHAVRLEIDVGVAA